MHRIATQVASTNTSSFVNVAFAVAALACLLMARPGLATEPVGASASPVPAIGDVQATTMPAIARVDLDGFASRAPLVATPTPARGPDHRDVADAAKPASAIGTVAEPATIAVLGFTAAALMALRRRKNAEA